MLHRLPGARQFSSLAKCGVCSPTQPEAYNPPVSPAASFSSTELIQIDLSPRKPERKPEWLKARAPMGETFHSLKRLTRELGLHTVCESAHCPNIGECWNHKTATFMMLGNS